MTGDLLSGSGLDRALEIVSDRHRRLVLLELRAGRVGDVSDVLLRGGDSERERTALEHQHLPKLADAGYVEWDRETGHLERGPNFGEVEPLVDLLARHADDLPTEWP